MLLSGAIVITEYLLIEVTKQVERFNRNIGAFQSAFYETPEVFQSVRMHLPVNVLFGMVNYSMSVFLIESPIGMAIIGRELRTTFDVISNKSLQSVTLSILKNLSSHFPATFQNSTNDNFVRAAFWHSGLSHFGALFFMHETGLTAYVGFIYFDVPLKFSLLFLVQSQAKSLQHEPCCFLSDFESAMNFQTAHAIFAIDQHPKSGHPLIQRDWRVLHDSSNLEGELLFAVIAKPDAASLDERVFRTIAARTRYFAIWPAQLYGVLKHALRIGEVNNRFLQCLWFLHALILAYVRLCVKYIITQFIPDWRRFERSRVSDHQINRSQAVVATKKCRINCNDKMSPPKSFK
jgi:hypothetical protein